MGYTRSSHFAEIEAYYRECENAYRDAWGLDSNKQLNLGLWQNGANSLPKALMELNRTLAVLAQVDKNTSILDAGCGVGGTAIFMAKNYGAKVTGITLSVEQYTLATRNVVSGGLNRLITIDRGDYMNTSYRDSSFDVIFGIESICYAEPKIDFLKEAYRLLKPGGRLVLAENLQGKEILNDKEREILYEYAFNGCKVISLDTEKHYSENMKKVGFREYMHTNKTKEVRPSIVRLRRFFFVAWLYNSLKQLFGRKFTATQLANTKMCYYLLTGLDRGLWKYGLIKAVK